MHFNIAFLISTLQWIVYYFIIYFSENLTTITKYLHINNWTNLGMKWNENLFPHFLLIQRFLMKLTIIIGFPASSFVLAKSYLQPVELNINLKIQQNVASDRKIIFFERVLNTKRMLNVRFFVAVHSSKRLNHCLIFIIYHMNFSKWIPRISKI